MGGRWGVECWVALCAWEVGLRNEKKARDLVLWNGLHSIWGENCLRCRNIGALRERRLLPPSPSVIKRRVRGGDKLYWVYSARLMTMDSRGPSPIEPFHRLPKSFPRTSISFLSSIFSASKPPHCCSLRAGDASSTISPSSSSSIISFLAIL